MGGLSLAIEGPSEAKMNCIDRRDGSCDVEYFPTEAGEYDITIRFADKHIPGSPFKVFIEDDDLPSPTKGAKLYGPAKDSGVIREGVPAIFFLDVSNAGAGTSLNQFKFKVVNSMNQYSRKSCPSTHII